jgi:flavin reductase (DIM6/NTAB) family NADH-FMN oxidoreductase RutF
MSELKEVSIESLSINPWTMSGSDWLLLTAEKPDGSINTMTAAWGTFGTLWGQNVAVYYIRPQRYTKEFVDSTLYSSVCVLPGTFRETLNYLGAASGRDENKIEKSGLTVARETIDGISVPYFAESRTVLLCRKLYAHDFAEGEFVDKALSASIYPKNDFHTMYVTQVKKALVRT